MSYNTEEEHLRCLDPSCGWEGMGKLRPEAAGYGACPQCGGLKLVKVAANAVPPSSSWAKRRGRALFVFTTPDLPSFAVDDMAGQDCAGAVQPPFQAGRYELVEDQDAKAVGCGLAGASFRNINRLLHILSWPYQKFGSPNAACLKLGRPRTTRWC